MKIRAGNIQLIIILLFVAFCIFLSKFLENDTMEDPNYVTKSREVFVPTIPLTYQNFREIFKTNGIVEARQEIEIIPQVSGRVVWVNEKLFKGEEFKVNEPLFEIDRLDYEINLAKNEADLARAYTLLDMEKAEADIVLEEWKTMHTGQDIPDLVARKPQMREAKAQLKSSLAREEQAKLDLERTIFKLPFANRLVKSNISEGQFLAAGKSYGLIYDSKFLEVHSLLTDKQLKVLSRAKSPKISIEVETIHGSQQYQGRVEKVASYLDQETRYSQVNFGFEVPDEYLMPGNFAKIVVTGNLMEKVLKLPASSVQNEHDLFLVDTNNLVSRVAVNIISKQRDYLIVSELTLPKSLAKYRIITEKIPGIFPGMKVITNVQGKEANE